MEAAREQQRNSTPGWLRAVELAAAFPAVLALSIGLVYVIGAALRTAELEAADVRVADALPLIPLEQLLARGIEPALTAFVGALLVVIGGAIVYGTVVWLPPEERASRPTPGWLIPLILVLLVVAAIGGALFSPPAVGSALLIIVGATGVLVAYGVRLNKTGQSSFPSHVLRPLLIAGPLALYVLLIGGYVIDRIIQPASLAKVRIEKTEGQSVEGRLVVISGGTVHAATADRQLVGLPESQVRSVHVLSPPPRELKTVVEYLTGWKPPEFLRR